MLELDQLVRDVAWAFKRVDEDRPRGTRRRKGGRPFAPGLGPLTEDDAVRRLVEKLRARKPRLYGSAAPKRYPGAQKRCDLLIPENWALEFKLLRPFGDNGNEAEHWADNVLHPYRSKANSSSIGDGLKLLDSGFPERKGIIVFGFEHRPAQIKLGPAVRGFELLAGEVAGLRLGPRSHERFVDLIHPHHQVGHVFGWEVLGQRISERPKGRRAT